MGEGRGSRERNVRESIGVELIHPGKTIHILLKPKLSTKRSKEVILCDHEPHKTENYELRFITD